MKYREERINCGKFARSTSVKSLLELSDFASISNSIMELPSVKPKPEDHKDDMELSYKLLRSIDKKTPDTIRAIEHLKGFR